MKVKKVKYNKGYLLEVYFQNGTVRQVNLKNFLLSAINPMTTKYRRIKLFKTVIVKNGHLSWGNSEMDLSAESLYNWKD